jgi:hypothetical protein
MANVPRKIRPPLIQTPWEPVAHRQDEILIQAVTDVLRELESIKLEATQFNASGATFGDILVADANLVFQPQKYVPLTFGVGTDLTVTGTATVTGNTTLYARLVVSGDPTASATQPKVQIGNPLVGGDSGRHGHWGECL